jgi:hypothetical protein
MALPGVLTWISTADDLRGFGPWLADWIDEGCLDDSTPERSRLDRAAEELTCELL